MNESLVYQLAVHKTKELKLKCPVFRYRHLSIPIGATIEVNLNTDMMILIDPLINLKVSSKSGFYDLTDFAIFEQQHIHSGKVEIQNLSSKSVTQIYFLQLIPKNHKS